MVATAGEIHATSNAIASSQGAALRIVTPRLVGRGRRCDRSRRLVGWLETSSPPRPSPQDRVRKTSRTACEDRAHSLLTQEPNSRADPGSRNYLAKRTPAAWPGPSHGTRARWPVFWALASQGTPGGTQRLDPVTGGRPPGGRVAGFPGLRRAGPDGPVDAPICRT